MRNKVGGSTWGKRSSGARQRTRPGSGRRGGKARGRVLQWIGVAPQPHQWHWRRGRRIPHSSAHPYTDSGYRPVGQYSRGVRHAIWLFLRPRLGSAMWSWMSIRDSITRQGKGDAARALVARMEGWWSVIAPSSHSWTKMRYCEFSLADRLMQDENEDFQKTFCQSHARRLRKFSSLQRE